MDANKSQKFDLINCPKCNGLGYFEGKTCPVCSGWRLVAVSDNRIFVWGNEISNFEFLRERTHSIIAGLVNFIFLAFGLFGIIVLGLKIYNSEQSPLFLWNALSSKDALMLVFWLSLLADLYLFYKFERDQEKIKYLPSLRKKLKKRISQPLNFEKINQRHIFKIEPYFSSGARNVIYQAWLKARKFNNFEVLPLHLLISLLKTRQIEVVFGRLGTPFSSLKSRIESSLSGLMIDKSKTILSDKLIAIIYQSFFFSLNNRQKKVEILNLFEEMALQENEVKTIFYDLDITEEKSKNIVAWIRVNDILRDRWHHFRQRAILRPKSGLNRSMTAIATPTLNAFAQDLTMLAQFGYLMPCIGREKEFETIFSVLSGGPRRSVLLVGNPGVGKNTIIEGLAQKMVEEDVPEFLQDKRLVSLSIAKVVSGVDPSVAQGRLLMILNEIRRSGNIILYISEIQNLVGITSGMQGSMDLSDVLAQFLSNNTVLCLASTLPGDYKRYIEDKTSVDNVFEKLEINETSGDEAIQILEAKVGSIEYKENIFFSYDAIASTVEFSSRYLHDRYLPEKAIQILQEVANLVHAQKGKNALVTGNDVAQLISEKTNIPLTEITAEESQKLLNLEDQIHQRMIDQEEAVKMVSDSLRRARAEMRDIKRPISNFLFLGPTGVGKTELAKSVAEVYFGSEKNMVRLDMSEYQEKTSINRLIGAPAGYSGSETGGFLTEAIRKNPFSLILLDEIEKAHPDILNLFLQVMDDGRLTDSNGKTIDFTNAILIATSNAGTKLIQQRVRENISVIKIKEELVAGELLNYFRPEFLNRFDGIIVFKPLALEDVKAIAKLMINKVAKDLDEKGIGLVATEEGIESLAQLGYDPEFGARPLRRVIQEKIQDELANLIISKSLNRRDVVTIGLGAVLSVNKASKI